MKETTDPPEKTTIFSINPVTNKPFMEYEDLVDLIRTHINSNQSNLLNKFEMDDLVQDLLIHFINKKYNLSYEPRLFVYLNIKYYLVANFNESIKPKNNFIQPFTLVRNEENTEELYSELINYSDSISPEDIILANEKFVIFRRENIRNAIVWGDDLKLAPSGWTGPYVVVYKRNAIFKENFKSLI